MKRLTLCLKLVVKFDIGTEFAVSRDVHEDFRIDRTRHKIEFQHYYLVPNDSVNQIKKVYMHIFSIMSNVSLSYKIIKNKLSIWFDEMFNIGLSFNKT